MINHLIIIGLLLVVIYLVWPSKSGFKGTDMSSRHLENNRGCGDGMPACPPGYRCYVHSDGKGDCIKISEKCGNGLPSCPQGERCYVGQGGQGYCA